MNEKLRELVNSYIKLIYKSQRIRTIKGFKTVKTIGGLVIDPNDKETLRDLLEKEIDLTFGIDKDEELIQIINKYV